MEDEASEDVWILNVFTKVLVIRNQMNVHKLAMYIKTQKAI